MVRQKANHGRRSAHATVARGLGLAIVSGEFPVGSFLPGKEALMQRYGVSNTVLREAMQALAAKGLVAARTKIGTWVAEQSQWNMFDPGYPALGSSRSASTRPSWRAFSRCARRSSRWPRPRRRAIARRRRPIGSSRSPAAMGDPSHDRASFTEIDVAFHLCLLEASGNPFMRSIGAAIATALAASFRGQRPAATIRSLAGIAHSASMRRSPTPSAAKTRRPRPTR